MTQLKPCPFCGNRAYIYPVDEEGCVCHDSEAEYWAVRCGTCTASIHEILRDMVVDAWNARIVVRAQNMREALPAILEGKTAVIETDEFTATISLSKEESS